MKKKGLVFLLAMDYEMKNIFDLKAFKKIEKNPFVIFKHKKKNIYILKTGVGKVNAASATQFVLDHFNPSNIINIGLAGCVNRKIAIGEVRFISEIKFFDVDVTKFGYKFGQIPECDVDRYKLIKQGSKSTMVISGDSFVSDYKKFSFLYKDFPFDFIDMECGSIAHVLYINNKLKLLKCYKASSDYADSSAASDFYKNEKIVFNNLKKIADKFI